MSSSGALKTVAVVSKVLYELLQQHKETFPELEELGQVILTTESVVSNFTPSPNQDEEQVTAVVSALVSGLERIHESIKKLDLHKGKVLFSEDFESNRILKQRDRIALITNILPKISEVPSFNISELLQQPSAREFWSNHLSSKIHVVKWEVFRAEFEQEYGKKPELDIARLKRVLDPNNEDQVSIFDFADFSDSLGMPEAFELLIKKYLPDIPAALPEDKNDPVQSNTVWRGVVTQTGCPEFDIVMQIKERSKDEKIHGVMYWRESDSGQTKIRGEVDGDTIKFEEYQVTHGIGRIPFPNSYEGKVSGGSISGIWTYGDQQGQFLLHLDTVPAVKTPTPVETDDKDRRATASSVASMSGFLVKQGKLRKTWKTRYCVLQGGAMRYYETKENYPLKPAGKIDLTKGAVVQERPDIGQKTTLFEIITPSRTFYIQAESSNRRTEWVQALRAEISNWKS